MKYASSCKWKGKAFQKIDGGGTAKLFSVQADVEPQPLPRNGTLALCTEEADACTLTHAWLCPVESLVKKQFEVLFCAREYPDVVESSSTDWAAARFPALLEPKYLAPCQGAVHIVSSGTDSEAGRFLAFWVGIR